jgi:site-specific recombinase XerD
MKENALACRGQTEFYAGVRSSEIVALDLGDVRTSARKGHLIVRYAKDGRYREVSLHPKLRSALRTWQTERATWPGANENPALFLNHRGGRLSTRSAYDILKAIATDAGPEFGHPAAQCDEGRPSPVDSAQFQQVKITRQDL